MLGPLVHPEILVLSFVVFPVGCHVRQEVGGSKGFEDVSDVMVGTFVVAIGFITAVAAVGPVVESVSYWYAGTGRVEKTYHRPWMVQASSGPVGGLVSQN